MPDQPRRTAVLAFLYGAPIGTLGGLIGLGGAEFRLPVLKAVFAYSTRRAIALNLAVSLVTLAAAAVIRLRFSGESGLDSLARLLPVIAALILGSIVGAAAGASFASRISVARLDQWVLWLLIGIGTLLIAEGLFPWHVAGIPWGLAVRIPLAVICGVGIGLVSSLLGVAGGELIIPTLVLLFGVDIKTAGTASVLVSFPTVLSGLLRYRGQGELSHRSDLFGLVVPMGAGSILGAIAGGMLVPVAPAGVLKVGLGVILVVSAVRIFRGARREAESTKP